MVGKKTFTRILFINDSAKKGENTNMVFKKLIIARLYFLGVVFNGA